MRLTDLRGKEVRNLDGKKLGKVHEVHCDGELLTALKIGPGSIVERLTAKGHGQRIAWECVRKVEADRIVVTSEPRRKPRTRKA